MMMKPCQSQKKPKHSNKGEYKEQMEGPMSKNTNEPP